MDAWYKAPKERDNMFSANVRKVIYAVIAIASPLVTFLGTEGKLDQFWVGLFSVLVSAVSGLAFSKVVPDEEL